MQREKDERKIRRRTNEINILMFAKRKGRRIRNKELNFKSKTFWLCPVCVVCCLWIVSPIKIWLSIVQLLIVFKRKLIIVVLYNNVELINVTISISITRAILWMIELFRNHLIVGFCWNYSLQFSSALPQTHTMYLICEWSCYMCLIISLKYQNDLE